MGGVQDHQDDGYPLAWPRSQRWNPSYTVPRNSLEQSPSTNPTWHSISKPVPPSAATTSLGSLSHQNTLVQRHGRTSFETAANSPKADESDPPEDLSDLSHWLETLSELYMNNLDNRARWDPRWLNVTHRERYGGLSSSAVTIIDYISGQHTGAVTAVTTKQHLAEMLQDRPKACDLRVVMITDLSRFTMGAIGQTYSIDPEFWFEHLANSGYAASDSQLKVNNAIWMNWSEQETRFRHRPLPGTGQRTEWNIPRRVKSRSWVHMKWSRLGLMHYLGKKGFNEAEIEVRLSDGRWLAERDVVLDKWGRYMTKQKLAKAKLVADEKEKKKQRKQKGHYPPVANPSTDTGLTPSKVKASNVYRPYSTFEGLPKNINSWYNRDLRVLAPEGLSHWSGSDEAGERVIVLVFDPTRKMKNTQTKEHTPSLTFMPRALEIESYSEEELWRSAGPEETYLDPPPPPITNKQIKAQRKEATKQNLKRKRDSLRRRFGKKRAGLDASLDEELASQDESGSESSYTSDDDYDEEYEEQLREEYENPKPYSRDRAFARKYSLSTQELVLRRLTTLSPAVVAEDDSSSTLISSLLNSIVLDDFWRLLAELRAELDHLDGDFSGALFSQLVESFGNSVRQNLCWMRCSLQELNEWALHLRASAEAMAPDPVITEELELLIKDVQALQLRAESTINMLASSMGLSQSSLVIDQTSGINKLTELAFFFVPLSFITSVFSMQVKELITAPPHIWIWALALGLVFLATYLIRILLRSPSVRIGILHCRATIINRFSSSRSSSAEHRLNTVGNRAVAKFIFWFGCIMILYTTLAVVAILFLLVVCLGLWLGAAGTSLYFIITRWPDPAVLAPCFLSLPFAAAGLWVSWLWADELADWVTDIIMRIGDGLAAKFPEKWRLDSVDDDDLSREGVNTYARQAITLAT
ncbi:Mg2+ transporter protein, CorA-like/Zinc transport protein ZntB [Cordyceps javanica]|uniref:Mg2+ transporter protein, CorA-like/Zinc transport protein ZntB n=1 Tax=Cordyceps javanica TaxID=43265 RepID=A0A545VCV7_9HYPO|nr:Mg2+ transporter protein, CorA-like/Zinc transport protein ZntB [Cordyceps javanica]TQW10773.1 Mg2+ transporter protein, CorA-like/Zinc transport protein ZntB [Cordyceps javanica]